jgi:tetratricopeptide (TPR) repeat protein
MRLVNVAITAAMLGAAAFVGTVFLSAPRDVPAAKARGGGGESYSFGQEPPHDAAGLERFVAGEGVWDPRAWFWLAEARRAGGNLEGAKEAWGRVLALASQPRGEGLDRDTRERLDFLAGWSMGRLGLEEAPDRLTKLASYFEKAAKERSEGASYCHFEAGWMHFLRGSEEEARRCWARAAELEDASRREGDRGYRRSRYNLACYLALAGQAEAALAAFEHAIELGWADPMAEWDPDLDSIRALPRFVAAIEQMRATIEASGRAR